MPTQLSPRTFDDFPATFKGSTYRPGDPGYPEVRQIWNMRRGDEMPALIVQPVDVDDIVKTVRYAVSKDVPLAVRGGGHGIDGAAMPDGALVVDTSRMKEITVDPETGRTTIQAGVLLGEMDAATQEHGLAIPAGVVTETGAAGLTLGGGIGSLTRRFGATVDSLLSVELVTTDGRVVTASADSNPELFWGMRGAGHNLGIATSLTYQAHKVGPEVVSGLLVYSAEDAVSLFSGLDDALARSPRDLTVALLVLPAPPLPGLPESMIGSPIVISLIVYTGPLNEYEAAMSAVRELAAPLADMVGPSTWVQANSIVDPFEPAGRRFGLSGGYMSALNADVARIAVDAIATAPAPTPGLPGCLLTFPALGGALFDRDEDATAFSRTGAAWLYETAAQWDSPSRDDEHARWIDATMAALASHASTNAYVNLTADRGSEWLRSAYGSPEKWERIVQLKRTWDPDNRLSYNKNVLRAIAGEPV